MLAWGRAKHNCGSADEMASVALFSAAAPRPDLFNSSLRGTGRRNTKRAGDGIRTHDNDVGNVVLYQLSYARLHDPPPASRDSVDKLGVIGL